MNSRPFYWSVRRELWENRSIWIVPMAFGAVALLALLGGLMVPSPRGFAWNIGTHASFISARSMAAMAIILGSWIVGAFYCLDALHGERRDRSILFWKSLPVSDRTTVLAKASIPLVVLPLIAFVTIIAAQLIILLVSAVSGRPSGGGSIWEESLVLIYAMIAGSLWQAPIYAWMLFVSAWAKRAVLLWAVLPPLLYMVVSKIMLNISSTLVYRILGQPFAARTRTLASSFDQLTPGIFLTSPGLWLGLAVTALLLAITIRLRRNREPM